MESVVGRGTLLAGRYRTLQPLASDLPGATSWEATDQILDRPVRVTVLHTGQVPQALDAARRAALATDPRLVRVLDVGEHEGVAYTVTEQVAGPSLAELVARGPLPADQARAIVGEAAAALESARRLGVHHLTLRPSVLHLTPDDRVLLTGLAVDAALLGRELRDADAATRADTVGLVGLLYAALTGRWPRSVPGTADGPLPHLAAAPVLEGAPVPPAELVSGVPNDLDTLCAVTLGLHDDGPRTPAELVQELEPWGDIRATDLFGTRVLPVTPAPTAPTAPVRRPEVPATPPRVQRTSVRQVFAGGSTVASRPGTPPPAVPTRPSAITGPAVRPAAAPAATPPAGATPAGPTPAAAPPTTPTPTATTATAAGPATTPTAAVPPARPTAPSGSPAAAAPAGATSITGPVPDDAPTTALPPVPHATTPTSWEPHAPAPTSPPVAAEPATSTEPPAAPATARESTAPAPAASAPAPTAPVPAAGTAPRATSVRRPISPVARGAAGRADDTVVTSLPPVDDPTAVVPAVGAPPAPADTPVRSTTSPTSSAVPVTSDVATTSPSPASAAGAAATPSAASTAGAVAKAAGATALTAAAPPAAAVPPAAAAPPSPSAPVTTPPSGAEPASPDLPDPAADADAPTAGPGASDATPVADTTPVPDTTPVAEATPVTHAAAVDEAAPSAEPVTHAAAVDRTTPSAEPAPVVDLPDAGPHPRVPLDRDADDADRSPLLPLGTRVGGLDVAAARESIAAHRFDPTRFVLLLVGLVIVVGLFTAYRALTEPVDLAGEPSDPAPVASGPAAEPTPEPTPAEQEPEPAATPAGPPVIASAAQLDPPPDGDQNEHPEAVPLAVDGDPATAWFTRTYSSPVFGGLKTGVGYAVTLAEPTTVSTVTLQVRGTGGRVEVRATDPGTPTQGEVLAEGALGPETVLTLSRPTETQHVVLWFTELPQTPDGSNRIELAEVTLS